MRGNYGKGFATDLVRRTRAPLTALDAATELTYLRFPPGNRLDEPKGDRAGQYSLRINDQWRICFIWTFEGPDEVKIVDCH